MRENRYVQTHNCKISFHEQFLFAAFYANELRQYDMEKEWTTFQENGFDSKKSGEYTHEWKTGIESEFGREHFSQLLLFEGRTGQFLQSHNRYEPSDLAALEGNLRQKWQMLICVACGNVCFDIQ